MNMLSACICLIDPRLVQPSRGLSDGRPVEASRATLKSDAYERQATIAIIQPTRLVHSFLFLFSQCQSPQQLASDVEVSNLAAVRPAKHIATRNSHSLYALIAF